SAPHEVEDEIAEEIVTAEHRIELSALVERPAGDRCAGIRMAVGIDRRHGAARTRRRRRERLAHRPPEIVAGVHQVDLLEGVLANVSGPEQAGTGIEAEPERIAQAVREDEGCRAAATEKRIPGSGAAVEREAQDLSVQAVQVLGIRIHRLTGAAAVAEARSA